jgi:hypothetical protein
MTSLPAPEQWVLQKMSIEEVAEMIERHIDFIDEKTGRSVHLPTKFVKHYMRRDDRALPTAVAISQLPLVLFNGEMLAPDGLDRLRGIIFIIPKELRAILPRREDCTEAAVKAAMEFLTDEWLADVATDYVGKCILIACALTIIERSLIPTRPIFFVTAGRRSSGKTTTLTMMIKVITGMWPAAAAWTYNEDERRKALFSYLMAGVPYILWDNISRGSQINCPHIERSCTSAFYTDRKLGVSEAVATAAATIHLFTGNNIAPCGDVASRSLSVRLNADRPDPENRDFKHPDPIGWTDDNRAEILQALYTVLLGNPMLDAPRGAAMKTRFKEWWRIVGSAVENAAAVVGRAVDFTHLFQLQDEEDEHDISLADALVILKGMWPTTFKAIDVSTVLNTFGHPHQTSLREFLYPEQFEGDATPKSVGKRLKRHLEEPVRHGGKVYVLKQIDDPAGGKEAKLWTVEVKDSPGGQAEPEKVMTAEEQELDNLLREHSVPLRPVKPT